MTLAVVLGLVALAGAYFWYRGGLGRPCRHCGARGARYYIGAGPTSRCRDCGGYDP